MTPQDLQRIRSSPGWRRSRVELFHDTSVGSVIVKGQRAQRPAWRYRLLNGLARLIRLPLLKAAPALIQKGFRNVFQLEGGILQYFEECGDAAALELLMRLEEECC